MNKATLTLVAGAMGATTMATSCTQSGAVPSRPNIIYILADDLGYGDTGCYGADKIKTPNIDQLASEGRRFTDAHSASAVSTPSRYAILTGEYPFRGQDPTKSFKGLYGPLGRQTPLIIDVDDLSLPEMLQRQGYQTAAIGKWHLGWTEKDIDWNAPLRPGPNEVGFDYYFGVPLVNSGAPYFYVENDKVVGYDPNDPIHYLGEKTYEGATPTQEYLSKTPNKYSGGVVAHSLYKDDEGAETLLGKAFDWLNEAKTKEEPFFIYFASTHIHHPFTPSDRFKGSSEAGIYGDYAQELDWMIGEMMAWVDDNNLRDNTIFIVTSDNGGMINYGGQEAWDRGHKINGDLLGYKFGIWEGGHRIPFIVRWPGVIEPGTTSDATISNVDMMATLAEIVEYELQPGDALDSFSVLESWIGEPQSPIRDYLVTSPYSSDHTSIRMGDWVYIPAQGAGGFKARNWGDHGLGSEAALAHTGQLNS
ncbi:MAG: arylsulfatase, partial [Rikenellaceae bacterium]